MASDKPDAVALERAARGRRAHARVPAHATSARATSATRRWPAWLGDHGVELVVLAGYMQLRDAGVPRARSRRRSINVHPSLLPAFPGIAAIAQALDYGAKVTGVTVHFVDEGVDTGAIILQRAIEVGAATDPEELHRRLQPLEHELLPEAVRLFAAGRIAVDPANPRHVVVGDES